VVQAQTVDLSQSVVPEPFLEFRAETMADGGIQHRGGPSATRDMGSSGCRLATDSLSALGDRHPELTPRRLAPIGQTAEASLQWHWNRGGNGWPRA